MEQMFNENTTLIKLLNVQGVPAIYIKYKNVYTAFTIDKWVSIAEFVDHYIKPSIEAIEKELGKGDGNGKA